MTIAYVELSGDSPELAAWEATSAAEGLGGRPGGPGPELPGLIAVDVPTISDVARLAGRLALARRCLIPLARPEEVRARVRAEASGRESAAVRRVGRPTGSPDPTILRVGEEFVRGGGRIDLAHPARRFWLAPDRTGRDWLLEECGAVDRAGFAARRMPRLPFRRPVSLPPRLARAAANLARIGAGRRVLDPFLGTGALLAEAGLLGARIYGIDRSATMVRGALRNLAFLGVSAEAVVEGDAGEVDLAEPHLVFDAILTDPPYGRSSTTGGEATDQLVARVLPRWAEHVVPGGRIVLVVPRGSDDPPGLGIRRTALPVRVHRSLTREFRIYEPGTVDAPSPSDPDRPRTS